MVQLCYPCASFLLVDPPVSGAVAGCGESQQTDMFPTHLQQCHHSRNVCVPQTLTHHWLVTNQHRNSSVILSNAKAVMSYGAAVGGGGGASQYGRTPIRDELGLNDPDNLAIGSNKAAERARQARMSSELRSGLASLPKPQNEYEVRVPEAPEEADDDMAEPMEEDAADVAARRRAAQKAREEAELRKRSQVT